MSARRRLLIGPGAALNAVVAVLYFRRGAVQADLHPMPKQNILFITPPPSFDSQ